MERKIAPERRMLAAIMFTDIEGFTEKMNRRESMGFKLLHKHNEIMDGAVKRYGGRVVKSMGDSYMVCFDSVVNAVQCALEAQTQFNHINRERGDAEPLMVRISIHLGDVVVRDEDIFGDTVNLASHLQAVTPGGAICVSQEVYVESRGKISGSFKNMGFCKIRGLAEPLEVFRVVPKNHTERFATPLPPRPATAVITTIPEPTHWWAVVAGVIIIVSAVAVWLYR